MIRLSRGMPAEEVEELFDTARGSAVSDSDSDSERSFGTNERLQIRSPLGRTEVT